MIMNSSVALFCAKLVGSCVCNTKNAKYTVRTILQSDGPECKEKSQLCELLAALPVLGTYELSVRENKKQTARTAHVEVSCTNVWMPRPTATSPWVKKHGPKSIRMGVVQIREKKAPKAKNR